MGLSRRYSNDKHFPHATAARSSVAMPSISARWAASLSRGLHITMPSALRACRSRLRLLSRGMAASFQTLFARVLTRQRVHTPVLERLVAGRDQPLAVRREA